MLYRKQHKNFYNISTYNINIVNPPNAKSNRNHRFIMGRIYPEVEKLLEKLKSRQVFDADFNNHLPIRKTFHGVINQLLEMKHCNSVMFCEKTDLNKTIFSDLKKEDYKPIKRIVVTICIGLKLEYSIRATGI